MLERLGTAQPITLDQAIGAEVVDDFTEMMLDLGHRRDRARKMAIYASAVAGCPASPFGLPAIAAAAGAIGTEKQFRQLLDGSGWDETKLRHLLVRAAPSSEVGVYVVEIERVHGHDGDLFDIASIHALGEDKSTPIGWRRVPIPLHHGEPVPELSDGERLMIRELVADLLADYQALEPGPSRRPVIAIDACFGQNEKVRNDLADLGCEYILDVDEIGGPVYDGVRLEGHAYGSALESRVLSEQLVDPSPEEATGPPAAIVDSGGTGTGEYAVSYRRDGFVQIAIARPRISGSRRLTARLRHERTAELAELSMRVGDARLATALRVTDFRHSNPRGWQRHAMLMSVLFAILTEQIPRRGDEEDDDEL
jgi:hypothetical protein